MEGLILYRDSYPGGPIGYFSDLSQWTFVAKNYVFTAQTLMGDAVVVSHFFINIDFGHPLMALQLYRCYLVWQSKVVMILPVLLWCTVASTYDTLLWAPNTVNSLGSDWNRDYVYGIQNDARLGHPL